MCVRIRMLPSVNFPSQLALGGKGGTQKKDIRCGWYTDAFQRLVVCTGFGVPKKAYFCVIFAPCRFFVRDLQDSGIHI